MIKNMNTKKLITIILLAVILIVIAIIYMNDKDKKEEIVVDKATQVSDELTKEYTVEDFKITNTDIEYSGGLFTLRSNVINESKESKYIKSFDIIVKDKDGNVLSTLLGYIDQTINPGDLRTIASSTSLDLTKASSVEYKINK